MTSTWKTWKNIYLYFLNRKSNYSRVCSRNFELKLAACQMLYKFESDWRSCWLLEHRLCKKWWPSTFSYYSLLSFCDWRKMRKRIFQIYHENCRFSECTFGKLVKTKWVTEKKMKKLVLPKIEKVYRTKKWTLYRKHCCRTKCRWRIGQSTMILGYSQALGHPSIGT